jgi:hypothetical protein
VGWGHALVHFAIDSDGSVRPLCGDWDDDPSWTKYRRAVTCPACLVRLGDQDGPPPGEPASPHEPSSPPR